jgi:hypothetical protein
MDKFLDYVKEMWPEFLCGPHHELMAQKFEEVAGGKIKRLILNLPPRHTASEFASYLLPSWYLGRFPEKQVIQAASLPELSRSFKVRVNRLMKSQKYVQVFSSHGQFLTTSVGGPASGYCADLYIVDNPHLSCSDYKDEFNWFIHGPMCKVNPQGAMVVVMSRSSDDDLTGRLEKFGGWEIVKIPAMKSDGSSTWPEFWPEKRLFDVKKNVPPKIWAMKWQQNINEAG